VLHKLAMDNRSQSASQTDALLQLQPGAAAARGAARRGEALRGAAVRGAVTPTPNPYPYP